MESNASIRWVCALSSEAEPLIKNFDLKIIHDIRLFKVYRNISGSHWLIISGVGAINMALASMFLYQCSKATYASFWFNIGIAGFSSGTIGDFFLVDKIVDQVSGRFHFPRTPIGKTKKKLELLSVSKPCNSKAAKALVDMEGYAFFDTVNRFALREMISVVKIVSDNKKNGYSKLTKKTVHELILANLSTIEQLSLEAKQLSEKEFEKACPPKSYLDIVSRVHCSKTQRKFLEKLIRDWETSFPDSQLINRIGNLNIAKKNNRGVKERLKHGFF